MVFKRFSGVASVLAVVAAVFATMAYASAFDTYTLVSQTFANNQGFQSPNDNCLGYWEASITDNVHNHPSGKLGRSAIITLDGSWVRSTADTTSATWASLSGGDYYFDGKKGYSKNISGSSYTGNGRVWLDTGSVFCV